MYITTCTLYDVHVYAIMYTRNYSIVNKYHCRLAIPGNIHVQFCLIKN